MSSTQLDVPQVLVLDGTTGADKTLLGGKAWSIEKMRSLGIPVPPAFALTTAVCKRFYDADRVVPADVLESLPEAMKGLEAATGRTFGGGERPLLVSVRSGAAISMPGMMDTVLNLGMTDDVEAALAVGDPAYAADTRRRFIDQFSKVVGREAPADPWDQLHAAIEAVFSSWHSERAVWYRNSRGIPEDGGTAVTVQAMVFGNLDDRSGTGVLFSRNPLTGDSEPYGEWLPRGQGEDVVSGRADAQPLSTMADTMPEAHDALMTAMSTLERDGRDVQDIEFTVENSTLWLLQTRAAKRSPEAAARLAVQMCQEGIISESEALDRVTSEQVEALLRPRIDPAAIADAEVVATGKPACPGIAIGVVVTDADEAEDRADDGDDVVLARQTTDPDDVGGMSASKAVITELGGSTSHAAVVCREMGVVCVVGCGVDTVTSLAGQTVTVDGAHGNIYKGALPVLDATSLHDPDLAQLTEWARAEAGTDAALPELLRARKA
ncbi:MAG TPA: pyruvate, phosphate dikinase [Pseudonocardia sp.]|nr:pyruvate, phosphate dikinase [Pseudonocardia sp.]